MKAILIDDEERARSALRQTIAARCPQIELAGEAPSGAEGLALAERTKPDLIFLDVEMPGMTGFQMLEHLPREGRSVIFVTAFDKYAVRAFEYSAIGYLLKPVDPDRLVQVVDQAFERILRKNKEEQYRLLLEVVETQKSANQHNHRLVINTQEEMVFLHLKDLIHIEANGNSAFVYALGQPEPILVAKTMKNYVKLMEEVPFMMQVHRGHFINLYHVVKLVKGDDAGVMIKSFNGKDPVIVPVSPHLRKELIARLGELE